MVKCYSVQLILGSLEDKRRGWGSTEVPNSGFTVVRSWSDETRDTGDGYIENFFSMVFKIQKAPLFFPNPVHFPDFHSLIRAPSHDHPVLTHVQSEPLSLMPLKSPYFSLFPYLIYFQIPCVLKWDYVTSLHSGLSDFPLVLGLPSDHRGGSLAHLFVWVLCTHIESGDGYVHDHEVVVRVVTLLKVFWFDVGAYEEAMNLESVILGVSGVKGIYSLGSGSHYTVWDLWFKPTEWNQSNR